MTKHESLTKDQLAAIAQALADNLTPSRLGKWEVKNREDRDSLKLERGEFTLYVSQDYKTGRLDITGGYGDLLNKFAPYQAKYPKMTFKPDDSPAKIATRIEQSLLPDYYGLYGEMKSRKMAFDESVRLTVEAARNLASVTGEGGIVRLPNPRDYCGKTEIEMRTGPSQDNFYFRTLKTQEAKAELDIRGVPLPVMRIIIAAIKGFYDGMPAPDTCPHIALMRGTRVCSMCGDIVPATAEY